MVDPSGASPQRFCGLIPAYNVARTIPQVVEQARQHLPVVLVVDDGSQDETAHLARESGATVLSIPKNQGKGRALRSGFKDLLQDPWEGIITLDGDLQHDPAEVPKLIEGRVIINIYRDGTIVSEKGTRLTIADVEQRMAQAKAKNAKTRLHLRADKGTPYRHIKEVSRASAKGGVPTIIFSTYQTSK